MTLKSALITIVLSMCCTSSLALAALWYLRQVQQAQEVDPKYTIVALAQSTTSAEALKSAYLAELLDLSTDQPQNLYKFNRKVALQRLLGSSLIKTGSITKVKPGTLYIQYELREPIAFSGDFSNTAIDSEGFLIPFKPFFTPKKIPTLILGEQEEDNGKWGKPLQSRKASLALEALKSFQNALVAEPLQLIQLDVSRAHSLSFGQREIIALLEERREVDNKMIVASIYLRLSPQNYHQELANFLKMRPQLPVSLKSAMIELRVPQLAFVVSESQSK